jgi:hypothetical protein
VVVSVIIGVMVTVPEAGTTALSGVVVIGSVVVRLRIRVKSPVRVVVGGTLYAAVVTPFAVVTVPLAGFTVGSGAGTTAGGVVLGVLGVMTVPVLGAVITAPVLRRSRSRARRPRRAGALSVMTTGVTVVVAVVAGFSSAAAGTAAKANPAPAKSARIIRFMLLPPESCPVPEPTVDPITGLEAVYEGTRA